MTADEPPANIVDVLAPVAVDTAYSYRAPPELNLREGDFVAMPLGTRKAVGVVWARRAGDGGNLKSVIELLPLPRVSRPMRDFARERELRRHFYASCLISFSVIFYRKRFLGATCKRTPRSSP